MAGSNAAKWAIYDGRATLHGYRRDRELAVELAQSLPKVLTDPDVNNVVHLGKEQHVYDPEMASIGRVKAQRLHEKPKFTPMILRLPGWRGPR